MWERYPDLVRLAYLVIDGPPHGPGPAVLLAAARRIVRKAARSAPADAGYAGLRRALAALLTTDAARPRWTDRIAASRAWSRTVPALGEPGPVRAALRELSADERLAYVLSRLEGLTPSEAAGELSDFLIVSPYDVDGSLAQVDAATGLGAAAQRAELGAVDPTLVRLRPLGPARVLRRLAAVALAVALPAAGLAGRLYERPGGQGGAGEPAAVDPSAWRRVEFPGWGDWPAQGELQDDHPLLRRAAAAWRADGSEPPVGRLELLYAGRVDGAVYVLMHDSPGQRATPMLAQYVERERPPDTRPDGRYGRVELLRPLAGDPGQPLRLSGSLRLLVPPWRTGMSIADPGRAVPVWHTLAVQDGLTQPIPLVLSDPDCRYVVLRTVHRAGGASTGLTSLVGRSPISASPPVWFHGTGDIPPPFQDDPRQWLMLKAAACTRLLSSGQTDDLQLGRVWEGELPERGGPAVMVTVGASADRPGQAVLISPTGAMLSEPGSVAAQADAIPEEVAAVWWTAPQSRRWYLVAAAGEEVSELEVAGELGHHSVRTAGPKSLVLRGPVLWNGPPDGRSALVQVIAHTRQGERFVLTP